MKMIETDNLTIGYDGKSLIDEICLSVNSGEIVTLIGPNGSGKSTLLKTISGMLSKISGSVYITGKELSEVSLKDRAKIISSMFTDRQNHDYVTCRDVIEIGRFPYTGLMGKITEEDERIIASVANLVGISNLLDKDFDKLSDGQRQRVLLARALVQNPSVLILDEPTSFLDVGYKIAFMSILKRMAKEQGIGILMSLHEIDLAASVSDKIVTVTADNKIGRVGKPKELLTESYIKELFDIENGSFSLEKGFSIGDEVENNIQVQNNHENLEEIHGKNPDNAHIQESNTKFIMVQGTMSNAGKSLIVAGLCRIFKQDGYKVTPFKSQNMALNSYITEDGLEMGRAQVMQAEAAGIKPDVHMNPILLKPTDDKGSQVIVNGEVLKNMKARDYFAYKTKLIPDIMEAVDYLKERYEIIVIEGAGSPAEINLKQNDIVNMGMAKMVDAPVVLVGDIDRGGVFAQLLGTLELLEPDEKDRVKGLIVNKFRGDKTILDPGIEMLEKRSNKPIVGVIPYMDVKLEDEDSLTERFYKQKSGVIDIAVVRLPHISNFTDFDVFEQLPQVSVRYVTDCRKLEGADLIFLPGSKNTIADMKWLRESGFEVIIKRMAKEGVLVFGICGGYQMLGQVIEDPDSVESGGSIKGIGLLDLSTTLTTDKCRRQISGVIDALQGPLLELSHKNYYGYEIHMGKTDDKGQVIVSNENVYGSYIHGLFDHEEMSRTLIEIIADRKNIELNTDSIKDYRAFKEEQYDKMADIMRKYLNMDDIYRMMGINRE